jgi:Tfp pilus assembly protein PilF
MAAADGHAPSSDIAGVYNWSVGVQGPANAKTVPANAASTQINLKDIIDNATHGQTVVPPAPTPSSDLTAEQLRAKAYVLMGQEKMKAKDYVSAENNFKMALNLDPDNATAEKGLAAAKKALGN